MVFIQKYNRNVDLSNFAFACQYFFSFLIFYINLFEQDRPCDTTAIAMFKVSIIFIIISTKPHAMN